MTAKIQTTAPAVFNFQTLEIRTYVENGDPWFNANDVCAVLGYANPRQAVQKNCKEKGVSNRYTPTKGGVQSMVYINEPNLYRLIIKSRKPEAEAFEEWVMEEVLPSIRKTGKYEVPRLSTIEERKPLRSAIVTLVNKSGLSYSEAHRIVHTRFGVEHLEELPSEEVIAAIEYIHTLIIYSSIQKAKDKQPKNTVMIPVDTTEDGQILIVVKNGFIEKYKQVLTNITEDLNKPLGSSAQAQLSIFS